LKVGFVIKFTTELAVAGFVEEGAAAWGEAGLWAAGFETGAPSTGAGTGGVDAAWRGSETGFAGAVTAISFKIGLLSGFVIPTLSNGRYGEASRLLRQRETSIRRSL
jgi:hypothetical protein